MARSLSISPDTSWIIVSSVLILASAGMVAYLFLVLASVPAKSADTAQYSLNAITELKAPQDKNVFLKTIVLAQPAISQNQTTYKPEELGKTNLSQLGQ